MNASRLSKTPVAYNRFSFDLKQAARALGGNIVGQQIVCPGPGHSPRDRSLSLRLSDQSPFGFIVFSYAGDDWRECRDYVIARLGVAPVRDRRLHRQDSPDVLAELRNSGLLDQPYRQRFRVVTSARNTPRPTRSSNEDNDYEHRQHEKDAWLWSQRRPIGGILVERYLMARAVAYAEQFIGSSPSLATSRAPAACARSAEDDSKRNQRYAGNLWREAGPIDGTQAARYLEWRHVLQPALEAGDGVLRFHPNCPFGEGARHPCLLALRREIHGDEPRAIQRIALPKTLMAAIQRKTFAQFTEAGGKIDRRTLGPKTGTAIKLSSDEIVTQGLTVGEGIETVLAGMVKGFGPAWALGDAGNVEHFPVLGGIETLTILVDNDADGRGQRAALECSARWTRAGREVLRAVPNQTGHDFNDVLIRNAAA